MALRLELHLVLDPGLPVLRVLDLVQEDVLGVARRGLVLLPEPHQPVETDELQEWVVEGRVEDAGGRDSFGEELLDGLEEDGCLADLTCPAQEESPRSWGRGQPRFDLAKGGTPPARQLRHAVAIPPRVELPQDGDELGTGSDHAAMIPSMAI